MKGVISVIMRRKILLSAAALSMVGAVGTSVYAAEIIPVWAQQSIQYCMTNNIISGYEDGTIRPDNYVTQAEMAKMLTDAFELTGDLSTEEYIASGAPTLNGISESHWAYKYCAALYKYTGMDNIAVEPSARITREEFAAMLVRAKGLKSSNVTNPTILKENFPDYEEVSEENDALLCIAVEKGWLKGMDGELNPDGYLTRAQVSVMLERAVEGVTDPLELGVIQSRTPMTGTPEVTLEQAKAWAKSKNAADIYVDIADTYWKYGEITGIKPEVLYAQAALETGYGHYGNRVTADMNNWAGIKKYGHNGDATEDHESFATPDDGVRAHFNHMCAYIGLAPIGEVHGRYNSVMTLSWAGTVKYVEQLGGKWCPNLYYGYMIVRNYINDMKTF